ncbi:hypothetical protein TMatcc_001368 [Talaromyces marneffei ATCC 18224]|uniref:NAD(P)-binding domain-containing protein n=2 Tax=Talaromyces marneffei TaxID=37727 RepID=B6QJS4_TALMQ|nr:uncharacterized protein EYB26_007400 [Talaromyces marneffei]EEA22520.1 conserved hypothetical protein [Talaromyces marneffei ATCC 18224]KAE8551420.1 hypothetical protein EYB25_005307 [Talaromyces marneffei]QGA19708.1 hypothetical protein EYB26_007400 [Talaromyces marneffei]
MTYSVAFFGATGGCTNACLASLLLFSDYQAIALARTPQKLIDSLKKQPGITDAVLAERLHIVKGDATVAADVKRTLLFQADDGKTESKLVDAIVSGIGAYPQRKKGTLLTFEMDNPKITEQSTTALVSAMREIHAEQHPEHKPTVTVISTTGLATPAGAKEDVPFGLQTLYHLLAEPHKDKKRMEEIISEKENAALFQGVVITRPTLLYGDGIVMVDGVQKTVRAGTEDAPARGYSIARTDVGNWIWQNVLKSEEHGEKWYGRRVSLAY